MITLPVSGAAFLGLLADARLSLLCETQTIVPRNITVVVTGVSLHALLGLQLTL